MAPLIIAERRIILFLISFIAGIICFQKLDHIGALAKPLLHITSAAFCVTFTLAIIHVWLWVQARSGAFLGMAMFSLICGAIGYALAALQYTVHQPARLDAPPSAAVTEIGRAHV